MTELQEFIQEARRFFHKRRTKFRKRARSDPSAEQQGAWSKLGDGYYGEAWEHIEFDGLVLKISGPAGWGYESDWSFRCGDPTKHDVWPEFARTCMLNPHENLPRIMHLEEVAGMAWGIMPRYEPMSRYSDEFIELKRKVVGSISGDVIAEHWMLPVLSMAFNTPDISIDIHEANIMQDVETGAPVLTDPFSSTGDGYLKPEHVYFEYGLTTEGDETC